MLDAARKVGFKPTGVELSVRLADIARQKGHEVINRNIATSPFDRTFDAISMMDVIEHLEDPKSVLESLKPRLGRNGQLVVYTPNHDSLIVRIADVFYRFGVKSPIENIYACTHTCFFTTRTLVDLLTSAGYRINEVKHFKYDSSRPGQEVSRGARLAIDMIESAGAAIGYNGFRMVIYADLPAAAG
jgi:2-polyprenyl-3-methyl-5-hydroxy-6-metoxy-1,4-benzoquinol methylase